MGTYDELLNNETFKQLLEQLGSEEKAEIQKNIQELMQKFDISLSMFTNAIEKKSNG